MIKRLFEKIETLRLYFVRYSYFIWNKYFRSDKVKTQNGRIVVSCSVCGGQDILHEQKEGRGLPPKDWVRKRGDNRKISWRGTWDVWTCKSCGETWRKLR